MISPIERGSNGLPDLRQDHDLLLRAVKDAGATALNYFRCKTPVYRKSDGSEVTDADLAVDAQLHAELCTPRPTYGWLSEETLDDLARLDAPRVWIVDPIDGTTAFIQDRHQWVISAALVEDGAPVAAVIYNPVLDELFSACRGMGAELNGVSAKTSQLTDLHGAHILAPKGVARKAGWDKPGEPEVITTFVYSIAYRMALVGAGPHILAPKGVARKAGWDKPGEPDVITTFVYSIAYRMALVGAGRADGLISKGRKSEWDVAAGALIVQEAGGRVTSTGGTAYSFNKRDPVCDGTIAAPPTLHGKLLAAIG